MPNMTVTTVDLGSVVLRDCEFRDNTLAFTAAGTVLEGTLLARNGTSGKLVPYATGGADGVGTPIAVITYEASRESAGDLAIRACVKGSLRKQRLVIHADGDDSNITPAIIDSLRDFGIVAVDVEDSSALDNQ